jgi:hypothetical protein
MGMGYVVFIVPFQGGRMVVSGWVVPERDSVVSCGINVTYDPGHEPFGRTNGAA